MLIIDAHAHLWDELRGDIFGKQVSNRENGRVMFGDRLKQMMPPYMVDGKNTAEILLSNMEYAGVGAAVITQEYIDGLQNNYLESTKKKFGNKFIVMGMAEFRESDFYSEVESLIKKGFNGIKVPAEKLISEDSRVYLNSKEMLKIFKLMEENNVILSIDLAEGEVQVEEMKDVIEKCPDLKVAIGHFGMVNRPGWRSQIELAKNKNVYIESGGITWLFHGEFYPYKGAVEAIKEAAEIASEDKLMWGSDYPRTMTEITYKMSYDFILKSSELSDTFKRKFLGETAKKFYEIEELEAASVVESILD